MTDLIATTTTTSLPTHVYVPLAEIANNPQQPDTPSPRQAEALTRLRSIYMKLYFGKHRAPDAENATPLRRLSAVSGGLAVAIGVACMTGLLEGGFISALPIFIFGLTWNWHFFNESAKAGRCDAYAAAIRLLESAVFGIRFHSEPFRQDYALLAARAPRVAEAPDLLPGWKFYAHHGLPALAACAAAVCVAVFAPWAWGVTVGAGVLFFVTFDAGASFLYAFIRAELFARARVEIAALLFALEP